MPLKAQDNLKAEDNYQKFRRLNRFAVYAKTQKFNALRL